MTRRGKGPLIPVLNAHNLEVLRLQGVPSGKERTLADAQARKADHTADKPKKVTGGTDSGTALENLLKVLDVQGVIHNQTERGGRFGDQIHNATLVNANSPDFRVKTQGSSDTASTTNTVNTVVAMEDVIVLPSGKWAVAVMGSVHLAHSTGGSVDITTQIDTVEGTARTFSSVGTAGARCEAHSEIINEVDWIQGEQTLTVRVRFRCVTAGTTSAKNPRLFTIVRRME